LFEIKIKNIQIQSFLEIEAHAGNYNVLLFVGLIFAKNDKKWSKIERLY